MLQTSLLALIVAAFLVAIAGGSEDEGHLTFRDIEGFGCTAESAGFSNNGLQRAPGESLVKCGVALLRGALTGDRALPQLLDAFLKLPSDISSPLRHGQVREKRVQTHLPDEAPFSTLALLGTSGQLAQPLLEALGKDFVLDLATVVEVPAGADFQDPHRDSAAQGSVAAHIPLHALDETSAPLGFCSGTHVLGSDATRLVVREAILYRRPGEGSQEAKRRLYCGGHIQTDEHSLVVNAAAAREIKVRDSRLGVSIAKLKTARASSLEWKEGDELTHADGKRINHSEDWEEFVDAAKAAGKPLEVRLERPRPAADQPKEPPLMIIGAPLGVGDVVLYDSRTFHWGMKNHGSTPRYVLYVNFKSSAQHQGVHPEAHGTPELKKAREAFQQRLARLRKDFEKGAEL